MNKDIDILSDNHNKHNKNRTLLYSKKLSSILQRKAFRGYMKVQKHNVTNNDLLNLLKKKTFIDPVLMERIKNPYPFEDEYNLTYKDRYLKPLQIGYEAYVEINNVPSKKQQKETTKKQENFFITVDEEENNKEIGSYNEKNKKYNNDNHNKLLENRKLIKKIFPENLEEIKMYNNLPFIYLNKNPYNLNFTFQLTNDPIKNQKIFTENFLYKISHQKEKNDIDNKTSNNFRFNKGLLTTSNFHYDRECKSFIKDDNMNNNRHIKCMEYNGNGKKTKKKEIPIKLELDIDNLRTGEKTCQLTGPERHLKIIEDKIKSIKGFGNDLFNDFEKEFLNKEDEEETIKTISNQVKENDVINKSKMNKNSIISGNSQSLSNEDKNIIKSNNNKIIQINPLYQESIEKNIPSKTEKIKNQLRQIKNPRERFEFIHDLVFEKERKSNKSKNFKRASMTEESERNRLAIIRASEVSPRLMEKKTSSNYKYYRHICKAMDMEIANKLRFEFNPDDIRRILNGLKPKSDFSYEKKELKKNYSHI